MAVHITKTLFFFLFFLFSRLNSTDWETPIFYEAEGLSAPCDGGSLTSNKGRHDKRYDIDIDLL